MSDKSKGKGDALKAKDLRAKDAKAAGEVKGGMLPRFGAKLSGTQATSTVCATGPKSEDCAC